MIHISIFPAEGSHENVGISGYLHLGKNLLVEIPPL